MYINLLATVNEQHFNQSCVRPFVVFHRNVSDYLDMMRNFEVVKRRVNTTSALPLTLKIPATLCEWTRKHLNKTFDEAVSASEYAATLSVVMDKLRISAEIARELFQTVADKLLPSIDQCIEDVDKLATSKPISMILLVGGFSESEFMQEIIKQR